MKFKRLVLSLIPDKYYIKAQYFKKFKRWPNLKKPSTLNEKIQWKKLFDRKPIYTTYADKYLVREIVEKRIGKEYLIPLIDVLDNPDKFSIEKYPNSFVAKANHASGLNLIVKDKSKLDVKEIKGLFKKWLRTSFYKQSREWQYKNIKRKIVIEKFIETETGEPPADYKFHCFNGEVLFIQIDLDRFVGHTRNYYNTDWELLPFLFTPMKKGKPELPNGKIIEKPVALEKMIELSKKLAKDMDYIRVDFYYSNNQIYFGELTLHHGSGLESFIPEKYDQIFGEKIKLW